MNEFIPFMPSLKPGRYISYEGHIYWVLNLARHSRSLEWMVICCNRDGCWVHPLGDFLESVEVNGELVPKFAEYPAVENYWWENPDIDLNVDLDT